MRKKNPSLCSTLEPLYYSSHATAIGRIRFINFVDSGYPPCYHESGGEYYGRYTENGQAQGPFARFLQEHKIVAQYTMPNSPEHNGVAKRRNRTLMNMVRSMRSNIKLA